MVLAVVLGSALVAPAWADERAEAEHLRLSGEMDQLAQRQTWQGVERKFGDLEKLGVELTYQDLLEGAYAARALGNLSDAYKRLKRAAALDSTKEVVDWMYAIDMNYGSVELIRTPKHGDVLTVSEMPFDPDQRTAVEKAVQVVSETGLYTGLLPRGSYVFCGQPFTVQPGLAVRIEVSPKMKKTNGIVVNVQTAPTWGSGADGSSANGSQGAGTTGTQPTPPKETPRK